MNNTTALNASRRITRTLSVNELVDFDEHYGIDYRLPQLAQRPDLPSGNPILRGRTKEVTLPCGMCVTHSDVQILRPYETISCHDNPLYILVIPEGCVVLTFNGQEHVVRSGTAFNSRLSEHQTMHARHRADYKLRALSLGLYSDGACRTGLLGSLMHEWERCQTSALIWRASGFLLSGLQYAQQNTISHTSCQLMLGRPILQLFGHGLSVCQVENGKCFVASGEQQRLGVVRRLLEQSPGKDYVLNELVQRTTMSLSSLRSKFRAAYGCSVLDYLYDCCLERARGHLLEGYSV